MLWLTISIIVLISLVLLVSYFRDTSSDKNEVYVLTQHPPGQDERKSRNREPAKRAHVAYEDKQSGLIVSILKFAPKQIGRYAIVCILAMIFTTWIGAKDAERIAAVSADIFNGEITGAFIKAFRYGKEPAADLTRIATGRHPYLKEHGLHEFVYIGSIDNMGFAIMSTPYSVRDHDPKYHQNKDDDHAPITGLSAEKASELCAEKYSKHYGKLASLRYWKKAKSNFLGERNITYSRHPEWTSTKHHEDSDYIRIISNGFDIASYIKRNGTENKNNGEYIRDEELSIMAFRCTITWENNK